MTTPAAAQTPDLRLYAHNLCYRNDDVEAVWRDIDRHDPDVIFLMECTHTTGERLESYLAAYPHRLIEPSGRTMGLALYSRVPLENARAERFADTRIPVFRATFDVDSRAVHFVGAHPWPPVGRWGSLHRAQMTDVTRVATQMPQPLVGDFNASSWSFVVSRFEHHANVRDAQHGFGLRKTWRLNPLFRLPLDHVLVSEEIDVTSFRHGDRSRSDHVPLVVDMRFADKTPNATTASSIGRR